MNTSEAITSFRSFGLFLQNNSVIEVRSSHNYECLKVKNLKYKPEYRMQSLGSVEMLTAEEAIKWSWRESFSVGIAGPHESSINFPEVFNNAISTWNTCHTSVSQQLALASLVCQHFGHKWPLNRCLIPIPKTPRPTLSNAHFKPFGGDLPIKIIPLGSRTT